MGMRRFVVRRERGLGWIVWDNERNGAAAAVYRLRRHAHRAAIHHQQIADGVRGLVLLDDGRYALRTPTGLRVGRKPVHPPAA